MGLLRTYRQISKILAEREGRRTSPKRVAHICRVAEMKIVQALLLADLAIRSRFGPGALHGPQAT